MLLCCPGLLCWTGRTQDAGDRGLQGASDDEAGVQPATKLVSKLSVFFKKCLFVLHWVYGQSLNRYPIQGMNKPPQFISSISGNRGLVRPFQGRPFFAAARPAATCSSLPAGLDPTAFLSRGSS